MTDINFDLEDGRISYKYTDASPPLNHEINSAAHKEVKKVCSHFSRELVQLAVSSGWESHETTALIKLIIQKLELSSKKERKFIRKCCETTQDPQIIASIEDAGFSMETQEKVELIYLWSQGDIERFIRLIEDSMDLSIIDPKDMDIFQMISALTMFSEAQISQKSRLVQKICSHSITKKSCGKILNIFTASMEEEEALTFVYDIITLDFFYDLEGKMMAFKSELPRIAEELDLLLREQNNVNDDGEFVESDDDGKGNLRDFVTYSDDDCESDVESDENIGNQQNHRNIKRFKPSSKDNDDELIDSD